MRYLALILVAALGVAAFVMDPLEEPSPGPEVAIAQPNVAVCPVEEGSGRTTQISILSTVNGPTKLTLFAGGEPAGSLGTRTGPSGSVVIPVTDVAAVGTVGGLIELPVATSAVGSVFFGSETMSGEACAATPSPQTFLTGGSTISGRTFVVHLMNPYAGAAVVDLIVQSESGAESNERFEAVVVPARASAIVDFTELVPGRESLSVAVETVRGRVIAVGRQGIEGDGAVWRAVEPAQDWYLPIPSGGPGKTLLIGSPASVDVEYQVDYFGPTGLEEALLSGTMAPRGLEVIDLAMISEEVAAVRVLSTGPVVPMLWSESVDGLSVTTASTTPASRWFLPGASSPQGGTAALVVLNTGIEDFEMSIRPLREDSIVRTVVVPADGVIEVGVEVADGYLIESTGPVVALWTAQRGHSSLAAIGVSLPDG